MRARLVQAANAILGECPLWSVEDAALYWIDIVRPAIYRYSPAQGQTGMWVLPEKVGCIGLKESRHLWVACRSGLHDLDIARGELSRISSFAQPGEGYRFNDGAADPWGRLWLGIMNEAQPGPHGMLCRQERGDDLQIVETGWMCPNGLGWSPDGRVFYATDSGAKTIWAYDYDVVEGRAINRRPFACIDGLAGVPDGLAVDEEGCVWSAIWDGWRIDRFDPDGKLMQSVVMPVQRPTSLAFGGGEMSTLFVTSASLNVGSEGLRRGAQSGGLFALDTFVRGLPANHAILEFGLPAGQDEVSSRSTGR